MSQLGWMIVIFATLLAAAVGERWLRDRARRAVPIRVHVNGTRGKSTVTRLVAAALRAAGIPTLAKVTGTEPRLILPDGSERPVRRLGLPNIREQLRTLWMARRLGARALVVECMALQPDLQWTSEHDMLAATCGVVTNVRTDHQEVMGRTLDEIAASLANTVPARGVLVLGDPRFAEVFRARADRMGTRLVVVPPPGGRSTPQSWLDEDLALALETTRQLGVPDDVARPAMAAAHPDPGACEVVQVRIGGRDLPLLDARAANDPESFEVLLAGLASGSTTRGRLLAVYNHRDDRPERLGAFLPLIAARADIDLVLTGDRPAVTLSRALRRLPGRRRPPYVPRHRLAGCLPGLAASCTAVVLCGNTRGLSAAMVS